MITTGFDLRLLERGFHHHGAQDGMMRIWTIIFLPASLQMTTALRPLVGTAPTLLPATKQFFVAHCPRACLSGGLLSFASSSLPWLPSADAVSNLLDAIHAESDRKVKGQMLVGWLKPGINPGWKRCWRPQKMKPSLGRLPQIRPFLAESCARLPEPKRMGVGWLRIEEARMRNTQSSEGRSHL
jgi:hypothetical protein